MAGDAIFLIDGERLVEMPAAPYPSEEQLQAYLARHPDLLGGAQMDAAAPRRWLLIDRELGVPAQMGGSAQFAIDHLFVDQDGVPTLVEVKRSTDTRLRREVVGQMLDYAANGLRFWPIEELRATFERRCAAEGLPPETVLADFAEVDDPDGFWEQVGDNLAAGRMRMIFVADRIPIELQTVVEFLNEHMDRVDVLAVEVKQYSGSGQQALVPRVFGMTATAQHTKSRDNRRRYHELLAEADPATREVDQRLDALVDDLGLVPTESPGSRAFHSPHGPLLRIYPQWNVLEVALGPIRDLGLHSEADEALERLNQLAGKQLPVKYPSMNTAQVIARWEAFTDEVLPVLLELRRKASQRP